MRVKPGTKNGLHIFAMIVVKARVVFQGKEYFMYKYLIKH